MRRGGVFPIATTTVATTTVAAAAITATAIAAAALAAAALAARSKPGRRLLEWMQRAAWRVQLRLLRL